MDEIEIIVERKHQCLTSQIYELGRDEREIKYSDLPLYKISSVAGWKNLIRAAEVPVKGDQNSDSRTEES